MCLRAPNPRAGPPPQRFNQLVAATVAVVAVFMALCKVKDDNIVQAMLAYAELRLGGEQFKLSEASRIIAIGSDRMMNGVREARHGVLAPHLNPKHVGIASINSPMQCMMKEVCAQCLQKHVDPQTGKEFVVFSCFNQDQAIDAVDFKHLATRLRGNSAQEKLANMWLTQILHDDSAHI